VSVYTPGPWRFDDKFVVWAISGRRLEKVAECWGNPRSSVRDTARLIAAAPDLLAACKAVLDDRGFSPAQAMAAVLVAIIKAEGEP